MLETKRVWNIGVSVGSRERIKQGVLEAVANGGAATCVACVNPHSQVVAASDPEFQAALEGFDVLLPDGVGTVMAARFLGVQGIERFTGPDFFSEMCMQLNDSEGGATFFFVGSTPFVLEKIESKMSQLYPNIDVVGAYSPPFGDSHYRELDEELVERINRAAPSFVWVGMTAPKQELWMRLYAGVLNAGALIAIGAEFDYFAETKRRPPKLVSRIGLQWMHRLIEEPRRTWRRHFVSMPLYVWNVMRERFGAARAK